MFPIWWLCTAFLADGTSAVAALLNSGLHVLLYFYYTVSIFGPDFQKWVWWKKYLILLQLVKHLFFNF
jgi:elongation of very long chain fatty acids protein 4